MNKLVFAAATALLLATTSAQAGGVTFQIDGQRVRIESPRGCNSLSCIQISAPGYKGKLGNIDLKGFGSKDKDDDDDVSPPATTTTAAPATTTAPAPAPIAAAPVAAAPAPAPAPVASPAPAPAVTNNVAPAPAPVAAAPAPAPVAAAPAPAPAPVAAAPIVVANSPVGVWATEENKGNVRIEQCGTNLCGYAVKTNERILINMKPSENKWVGRIHDPDSGRKYDSTIALRGPNALRVQGCAFGGMFCGGQTWKRVS
ncbi:DUF2147 domain-containing protein [Bradyrhizobium sp.]|uniref:DUF2147 domain-containing protein n=1 Tax=Bradyrhizobium sp. TaxID=376 RepID=UPI004037CB03